MDLNPQGNKKDKALRFVEFVMVKGRNARCSCDDINIVFERATDVVHVYESMITTKTQDDLKSWPC